MKLGIVGLPNVGKSTLFNAITGAGAEAANYLAEKNLIIPGAIVVLESGEEEIKMDDPRLNGYKTIKSTHYGKKTFVNILFYEGREDVE